VCLPGRLNEVDSCRNLVINDGRIILFLREDLLILAVIEELFVIFFDS